MKKNFTLLLCLSYLFSYSQNTIALQQFSSGYSAIVDIENCGDGRLFIVQESGQIMICDANGNKRTNAFLDITDRVRYSGEQGLLGLAFDPNYKTNGFFYVYYINKQGSTQVSRFKTNPNYPNKASAGSEKFILSISQPFTNHKGGCMKFGNDGYLYISTGDGGSGGDPNNNAQNPQSLLGKILRIDVHSGDPYSIPSSNPFVDSSSYKKEIWALGLRNPWKWSFDAQNGYAIIADVGQETWEEVNYQQGGNGGKNYGWRCYEGDHAYNTSGCNAQSSYKSPVYEYDHSTGDCAIIGGYVYRGKKYPDFFGKYFCTDYCSGVIRMLTFHGSASATAQIVYTGNQNAYQAFGEDKNHEIYLADNSTGTIYHVVPASALQNENNITVTEDNISIAPNPSHGYFIVNYKSEKTQQVYLRIQNTLGQQFYAATKSLNAGNNSFNITVHIPKGNYYVGITNAAGKTFYKSIRIE